MSQFHYLQSWAQSSWWGLRKKLRAPRVDPKWAVWSAWGLAMGGDFFSGTFGGAGRGGLGSRRSA